MPLRTAKPYIRVDSRGEFYNVSYFIVANRAPILAKSVIVEKGDFEGFTQQVTALIEETRERFPKQEK